MLTIHSAFEAISAERYTPGWSNSRFQDLVIDFPRLFYTNHEFENRTFGWVNLVPRVLSYPLGGASLRLSRFVGRVGENPGNEVAVGFDWFFLLSVSSISFDCRTQSNLMHELISISSNRGLFSNHYDGNEAGGHRKWSEVVGEVRQSEIVGA